VKERFHARDARRVHVGRRRRGPERARGGVRFAKTSRASRAVASPLRVSASHAVIPLARFSPMTRCPPSSAIGMQRDQGSPLPARRPLPRECWTAGRSSSRASPAGVHWRGDDDANVPGPPSACADRSRVARAHIAKGP
jgi:hypothetical protein